MGSNRKLLKEDIEEVYPIFLYLFLRIGTMDWALLDFGPKAPQVSSLLTQEAVERTLQRLLNINGSKMFKANPCQNR